MNYRTTRTLIVSSSGSMGPQRARNVQRDFEELSAPHSPEHFLHNGGHSIHVPLPGLDHLEEQQELAGAVRAILRLDPDSRSNFHVMQCSQRRHDRS
jgi:hypothetical protein